MEQLKDIIKNVVCCLASGTTNMEQLNADEFTTACDGIKDLAMAHYYCSITDAMEKSEYGKDYDEQGRLYYSRYMPSRKYYENPIDSDAVLRDKADKTYHMTPQQYRDMDMDKGRMYYTEPMHSESAYDMTKRHYTESKVKNPDNREENMDKLDKWMGEVQKDVKGLVGNMSPEERTMLRQKVTNLANTI